MLEVSGCRCDENSEGAVLEFRHEVIDSSPPGGFHDIRLTGDINGDGKPYLPKGRIDVWFNETRRGEGG